MELLKRECRTGQAFADPCCPPPLGKARKGCYVLLLAGLLSVSLAALGQQSVNQPPISAPAAVAASTQPNLSVAAPVSATYVLGAEDTILVTVWQEPALSGPVAVRPDGMISLPLLGDIRAEGFTPMLLGNTITQRLKKFVTNPTVTVTVTAVNSRRIFVIGEVQHVGSLALSEDMTPLQAIASAGGLTPYANARHIYILRGLSGKQRKIPFNYKKAIKNGDLQGISLLPGDTIVVP